MLSASRFACLLLYLEPCVWGVCGMVVRLSKVRVKNGGGSGSCRCFLVALPTAIGDLPRSTDAAAGDLGISVSVFQTCRC